VDPERARELLSNEREQIERQIAALEREGPEEGDDRVEPGDLNSEALYQDELDAGRALDLKDRLAAVERAEGRLEAGTYGISIQSGAQIPDERLEAFPTAELTVEEQERGVRPG
jgi:DnaK suppressor protein